MTIKIWRNVFVFLIAEVVLQIPHNFPPPPPSHPLSPPQNLKSVPWLKVRLFCKPVGLNCM